MDLAQAQVALNRLIHVNEALKTIELLQEQKLSSELAITVNDDSQYDTNVQIDVPAGQTLDLLMLMRSRYKEESDALRTQLCEIFHD